MSVLNQTFAQAIKRKRMFKRFGGFIPSGEEYYSHPTFVIDNLADYISIIAAISEINKDLLYGDSIIYRGMSDSDYNLLPGLARIKNQEDDIEETLINEFLTRRPDAFNGLSEFDILAKMQHYGLPTRLLDFSVNPLVALYFACEQNRQKPGRVLCHGTYLLNDSSEYVKSICTSATSIPFDGNYTVEEYCCRDRYTLKEYMTETYIYDITTVIRPKYWNQRITNQAGVFMIFPNNLIDRYKSILIHESELGLDMAIKEYGHGMIDPGIIRKSLELEPIEYYRNVTGDYLTDECFRKIRDAYKDKIDNDFWDIIKGRFKITDEVKSLSRNRISNGFCSIIIESKNKKSIIKDLSYIGFRADYIYPELEYTAKEIKRKFD